MSDSTTDRVGDVALSKVDGQLMIALADTHDRGDVAVALNRGVNFFLRELGTETAQEIARRLNRRFFAVHESTDHSFEVGGRILRATVFVRPMGNDQM